MCDLVCLLMAMKKSLPGVKHTISDGHLVMMCTSRKAKTQKGKKDDTTT